ncbi:MAG: hypothetical protein WCK48_01265 [bacterium]
MISKEEALKIRDGRRRFLVNEYVDKLEEVVDVIIRNRFGLVANQREIDMVPDAGLNFPDEDMIAEFQSRYPEWKIIFEPFPGNNGKDMKITMILK